MCVRTCVHACVHACVCVYVCVCVRERVGGSVSESEIKGEVALSALEQYIMYF